MSGTTVPGAGNKGEGQQGTPAAIRMRLLPFAAVAAVTSCNLGRLLCDPLLLPPLPPPAGPESTYSEHALKGAGMHGVGTSAAGALPPPS